MEHGANINDPGGAHCHKTTPLMDSAVNGHVNIVSYLVNHGANLAMKNDKVVTVVKIVVDTITYMCMYVCMYIYYTPGRNSFRSHYQIIG